MTILHQIDSQIPANKFFPPIFDKKYMLTRNSILSSLSSKYEGGKKNIVIEAQAGQGKTTVISQFLDIYGYKYAWYQIGQEDFDPVVFFTAFTACLSSALPQFSSPRIENIVENGELGVLDINSCANILFADLNRFLDEDVFIVFDDMHFLENSELSNNFLDYIVDTAPPRLRFILASRRPLLLNSKFLKHSQNVIHISNDDLAMSSAEAEELFQSVFDLPISQKDVNKIHKLTDSWTMGTVMAAHKYESYIQNKKNSEQADFAYLKDSLSFPITGKGDYIDYFRNEILTQIPDHLHEPLLLLSFLEEIPVQLALHITERNDIHEILIDLMDDNYFIRSLSAENTLFRFHHLFQEFLQIQAKRILDEGVIDSIYQTAAIYYTEKQFPEKALRYYVAQNNFTAIEALLIQEGMTLISQNRTVTLYSILSMIDEDIILKFPWLSLFLGLLCGEFTPAKSLSYVEAAITNFQKQQNEIGELIALGYLINFHTLVSGHFNAGISILERSQQLFSKNSANLPDFVFIMVSLNIATGLCFFKSDMQKAKQFATIAQEKAAELKILSFTGSTRFVIACIEILQDASFQCRKEAEISYLAIENPLVGVYNKLIMRASHICYLSMHGDYDNFDDQVLQLKKSITQNVTNQTMANCIIYTWACSNSVAQGRYDDIAQIINLGSLEGDAANTQHMKSTWLQWEALIHAIKGRKKEALKAITESQKQREIVGGPFYHTFNIIMAGAVYRELGLFDKAIDILGTAFEKSKKLPSKYLMMCSVFNRAVTYKHAKKEKEFKNDIKTGMAIMEENQYDHFWSMTPDVFKDILTAAVRYDINKKYAKRIAFDKLNLAITETDIFPVMQITLLGDFKISFGSDKVCYAQDFTPTQRELLSMLFCSKNFIISQNQVQLTFWPDSTPSKARSKMDSLLTRVRKIIGKACAPYSFKNYLSVTKGIIKLTNCNTDAKKFTFFCEKTFHHANKNERWQANNAAFSAIKLWKDTINTEFFTSEQARKEKNKMEQYLSKACILWTENLAESDRSDEAVPIIEKALRYSPLNKDLIRLIYKIHTTSNNFVQAKKEVQSYTEALMQIGCEQEEIDTSLEHIYS